MYYKLAIGALHYGVKSMSKELFKHRSGAYNKIKALAFSRQYNNLESSICRNIKLGSKYDKSKWSLFTMLTFR